MKAEKTLKAAGLDVRLMPVPRQLSSDCGLSIMCHLRDREAIEQALDEAGCPYEELHAREGESYQQVV